MVQIMGQDVAERSCRRNKREQPGQRPHVMSMVRPTDHGGPHCQSVVLPVPPNLLVFFADLIDKSWSGPQCRNPIGLLFDKKLTLHVSAQNSVIQVKNINQFLAQSLNFANKPPRGPCLGFVLRSSGRMVRDLLIIGNGFGRVS